MRKSTIVIAAIVAGMIASLPANAQAAYNPIPSTLLAAAQKTAPPPRGTTAKRAWAICRIFGRTRCHGVLNVAWCESGLRPWASNGQYQGVFQMGYSERLRFGHGATIWVQARAARRYWLLSGYGPWECRPFPW